MKNNFAFRLFVFISIFSLCLSSPGLNAKEELPFENPNLLISMDFQDANLKDILKIFSIQSGLNFIASEQVKDRIFTLYFDKVPIKDAMDKIFKANNLIYELDPEANIFIVKDLGAPEIELVTKVFKLKYASVSSSKLMKEVSDQMEIDDEEDEETSEVSITTAVKKLLSKNGSVIEDNRINSLIVQDIASRIPMITQAILSLDVPAPQVMLEVEMLDVSKNTVDKMGVLFSQSPFKVSITGASGSIGFPFESWAKSFFTEENRGTLGINTTAYTAQLDFLRTQTDTKYLARPKILTSNNETAEIKIATQESIGVTTTTEATTGTTSATPERSETGVVLRVTPQINLETGEITMFLYPKVAEAVLGTTFTSSGASFQFRDPEERSTKSVVRIKDGETVVIGGLLRNEVTNIRTKVPFFGDLPLIGGLFRHRGGGASDSPKDRTRELLVFITPRIIKDRGIELAQAAKPVNPLSFPKREQGAFSAIDRQAVIKSSLNTFEK
ncbi:MAG: secretin N-terminal domain-containing protein [Candidatus Omnitrophota bacterium]|jgi:type IV pilus assembly protein PilQ